MYLICQVTSRGYFIEVLWGFLRASSLMYLTTMASLVTKVTVIVKMFLICHVTSRKHIFKGLLNLCVEVSHRA